MSIEAPGVPWLRINACTFQDAALIRGGFWASVAWVGVLTMAKSLGWRGGYVPRGALDEFLLAHHLNGGVTDETVTRGLKQGIEALVREGLLSLSGGCYQIRSWAKYQSDPSNAERQSRHREKHPKKKRVTGVTQGNGSNGDVTGRDVTKSTSTSQSTPASSPHSTGAVAASAPGGSGAAPSVAGVPSSNGHDPAAPPNGHPTIAAIRAELAGRALPRALTDAERTAHAERVRAQAAALAAGDPPCPATDPETTAATSRPTTAPPPNAGSPTSTPTEASAASAP